MNHSQLGLLSESKFITEALSRGFDISVPIGNHQSYDLVVHCRTKVYRVQVKQTSSVDETVEVRVRRSRNQRYVSTDYDVLAVYLASKDEWYLMPFVSQGKISIGEHIRSEYKDNWAVFKEDG